MNRRPLTPGDVIHGFAHGAFGRDHYLRHCTRCSKWQHKLAEGRPHGFR